MFIEISGTAFQDSLWCPWMYIHVRRWTVPHIYQLWCKNSKLLPTQSRIVRTYWKVLIHNIQQTMWYPYGTIARYVLMFTQQSPSSDKTHSWTYWQKTVKLLTSSSLRSNGLCQKLALWFLKCIVPFATRIFHEKILEPPDISPAFLLTLSPDTSCVRVCLTKPLVHWNVAAAIVVPDFVWTEFIQVEVKQRLHT